MEGDRRLMFKTQRNRVDESKNLRKKGINSCTMWWREMFHQKMYILKDYEVGIPSTLPTNRQTNRICSRSSFTKSIYADCLSNENKQ